MSSIWWSTLHHLRKLGTTLYTPVAISYLLIWATSSFVEDRTINQSFFWLSPFFSLRDDRSLTLFILLCRFICCETRHGGCHITHKEIKKAIGTESLCFRQLARTWDLFTFPICRSALYRLAPLLMGWNWFPSSCPNPPPAQSQLLWFVSRLKLNCSADVNHASCRLWSSTGFFFGWV